MHENNYTNDRDSPNPGNQNILPHNTTTTLNKNDYTANQILSEDQNYDLNSNNPVFYKPMSQIKKELDEENVNLQNKLRLSANFDNKLNEASHDQMKDCAQENSRDDMEILMKKVEVQEQNNYSLNKSVNDLKLEKQSLETESNFQKSKSPFREYFESDKKNLSMDFFFGQSLNCDTSKQNINTDLSKDLKCLINDQKDQDKSDFTRVEEIFNKLHNICYDDEQHVRKEFEVLLEKKNKEFLGKLEEVDAIMTKKQLETCLYQELYNKQTNYTNRIIKALDKCIVACEKYKSYNSLLGDLNEKLDDYNELTNKCYDCNEFSCKIPNIEKEIETLHDLLHSKIHIEIMNNDKKNQADTYNKVQNDYLISEESFKNDIDKKINQLESVFFETKQTELNLWKNQISNKMNKPKSYPEIEKGSNKKQQQKDQKSFNEKTSGVIIDLENMVTNYLSDLDIFDELVKCKLHQKEQTESKLHDIENWREKFKEKQSFDEKLTCKMHEVTGIRQDQSQSMAQMPYPKEKDSCLTSMQSVDRSKDSVRYCFDLEKIEKELESMQLTKKLSDINSWQENHNLEHELKKELEVRKNDYASYLKKSSTKKEFKEALQEKLLMIEEIKQDLQKNSNYDSKSQRNDKADSLISNNVSINKSDQSQNIFASDEGGCFDNKLNKQKSEIFKEIDCIVKNYCEKMNDFWQIIITSFGHSNEASVPLKEDVTSERQMGFFITQEDYKPQEKKSKDFNSKDLMNAIQNVKLQIDKKQNEINSITENDSSIAQNLNQGLFSLKNDIDVLKYTIGKFNEENMVILVESQSEIIQQIDNFKSFNQDSSQQNVNSGKRYASSNIFDLQNTSKFNTGEFSPEINPEANENHATFNQGNCQDINRVNIPHDTLEETIKVAQDFQAKCKNAKFKYEKAFNSIESSKISKDEYDSLKRNYNHVLQIQKDLENELSTIKHAYDDELGKYKAYQNDLVRTNFELQSMLNNLNQTNQLENIEWNNMTSFSKNETLNRTLNQTMQENIKILDLDIINSNETDQTCEELKKIRAENEKMRIKMVQMIGNISSSETELVGLSSELKGCNNVNDKLKMDLIHANKDVLRLNNVCQNLESLNQELSERNRILENEVSDLLQTQNTENEIKNKMENKINHMMDEIDSERKANTDALVQELYTLKKKHSLLFNDYEELKVQNVKLLERPKSMLKDDNSTNFLDEYDAHLTTNLNKKDFEIIDLKNKLDQSNDKKHIVENALNLQIDDYKKQDLRYKDLQDLYAKLKKDSRETLLKEFKEKEKELTSLTQSYERIIEDQRALKDNQIKQLEEEYDFLQRDSELRINSQKLELNFDFELKHIKEKHTSDLSNIISGNNKECFQIKEEYNKEILDVKEKHRNAIKDLENWNEANMKKIKSENEGKLEDYKKFYIEECEKTKKENDLDTEDLKKEHELDLDDLKKEHELTLEKHKILKEEDLENMQKEYEEKMSSQKTQYQNEIDNLRKYYENELVLLKSKIEENNKAGDGEIQLLENNKHVDEKMRNSLLSLDNELTPRKLKKKICFSELTPNYNEIKITNRDSKFFPTPILSKKDKKLDTTNKRSESFNKTKYSNSITNSPVRKENNLSPQRTNMNDGKKIPDNRLKDEGNSSPNQKSFGYQNSTSVIASPYLQKIKQIFKKKVDIRQETLPTQESEVTFKEFLPEKETKNDKESRLEKESIAMTEQKYFEKTISKKETSPSKNMRNSKVSMSRSKHSTCSTQPGLASNSSQHNSIFVTPKKLDPNLSNINPRVKTLTNMLETGKMNNLRGSGGIFATDFNKSYDNVAQHMEQQRKPRVSNQQHQENQNFSKNSSFIEQSTQNILKSRVSSFSPCHTSEANIIHPIARSKQAPVIINNPNMKNNNMNNSFNNNDKYNPLLKSFVDHQKTGKHDVSRSRNRYREGLKVGEVKHEKIYNVDSLDTCCPIGNNYNPLKKTIKYH